jgi:SAM-dependent methyltransferase
MHASREDYQHFHRRRYRVLTALLDRHAPKDGVRCLDVGGGGDITGASELLRARFAELHAVEQGADVEEGRRRGVETRAVDVDREPLPYPDAHFDLVLFTSVIEHLYNPRGVVDEIARVLRPGGVLVLEAPNAVALGRRLDAVLGRNPFRWFNRYNAVEGRAPLELCSIFYTAEEAEAVLGTRFETVERRYAMHDPRAGVVKRALRELAYRMNPRLADCFFVVARRAAP